MCLDEHQMVARACSGDRQAAANLVDRHYAALYAFLRRLAGNQDDAADLTQRTFARVWTSLATFAGRSSLSSWLHGVAHHVFVDWLRSNHRDRVEARPEEWWAGCRDPGASPDRLVADADLAAVLYAAVDRLETDLRLTVHLHYYQGLTLLETAEALRVSPSTIKHRLRLALAILHRRLAESPTASRLPLPASRRP